MAIMTMETPAGARQTTCIPRSKIAGWLASIETSRVKPELREALLRYQVEADAVLDRHFRLRQQEQADEIERLRRRHEACAAFARAFNPIWNKIAALQQAGIERATVHKYFSLPAWKVLQIVDEMETYGVISPDEWRNMLREWRSLHPEGREQLSPLEAAAEQMALAFPPEG